MPVLGARMRVLPAQCHASHTRHEQRDSRRHACEQLSPRSSRGAAVGRRRGPRARGGVDLLDGEAQDVDQLAERHAALRPPQQRERVADLAVRHARERHHLLLLKLLLRRARARAPRGRRTPTAGERSAFSSTAGRNPVALLGTMAHIAARAQRELEQRQAAATAWRPGRAHAGGRPGSAGRARHLSPGRA